MHVVVIVSSFFLRNQINNFNENFKFQGSEDFTIGGTKKFVSRFSGFLVSAEAVKRNYNRNY